MWAAAVESAKLRPYGVTVPNPFKAAPPDTSLEQLFAERRFGEVLDRSATELKKADVPKTDSDLQAVLEIWYLRLRALLTLKLGGQAAEEYVACLAGALNDQETRQKQQSMRIIWDIRLLVVPAAAKGINNAAIQAYYILADDARSWGDVGRIGRAGEHVVAALLALRDYSTALDLLKSMYANNPNPHLAQILVLVFVHVGDTLSAQEWVSRAPPGLEELIAFADNESGTGPFAELYRGNISKAISDLESIAAEHPIPTIANLLILYDLQHEDTKHIRHSLAERLVANGCSSLETYF